jgi:hypothetical protein
LHLKLPCTCPAKQNYLCACPRKALPKECRVGVVA